MDGFFPNVQRHLDLSAFVHRLKRLNCVLISRCEYPSRNPTSPLDCGAADRFSPSSLALPALGYMLHFQPSPLALRKRTSTAQRHKCALQAAERARHGRQADGRRRRRVPVRRRGGLSVFVGNRGTGWWICLFKGFGSGARITSHGTKTRLLPCHPPICFARRVDASGRKKGAIDR